MLTTVTKFFFSFFFFSEGKTLVTKLRGAPWPQGGRQYATSLAWNKYRAIALVITGCKTPRHWSKWNHIDVSVSDVGFSSFL